VLPCEQQGHRGYYESKIRFCFLYNQGNYKRESNYASLKSPVYEMPDDQLPPDWRIPGNLALHPLGDQIFRTNNYLATKARSAVLPQEYNYILNPLFPGFYEQVKVVDVSCNEPLHSFQL
jgi:hypothetical protein